MGKKYPMRPETYERLIERHQTSAPLEFLEALACHIAARYQIGVILEKSGHAALAEKGRIWEREYGDQLRRLADYANEVAIAKELTS